MVDQTATEQAADAIMCATVVPMGWPEAFMYIGCAFAIALIVYAITKQ